MNFIFITGAIFLAIVSFSANSSPVSTDWKTAGDGLITRDLVSGLDWLDLNETQGKSFNYVNSQFLTGGLYEGWRYATETEVSDFWDAFGGDSSKYSGWSFENNGLFDLIAPLWGDMNCARAGCAPGEGYSSPMFIRPNDNNNQFISLMFDPANNERSLTEDFFDLLHQGLGPDIEDMQVGSALVRTTPAIPIPSAIWLFCSGLIGLIGFARRKARS